MALVLPPTLSGPSSTRVRTELLLELLMFLIAFKALEKSFGSILPVFTFNLISSYKSIACIEGVFAFA